MRTSTMLLLAVVLLAPISDLAQAQDSSVPPGPSVRLELIAEGFTHPVMLAEAPDGTGRLFVVDQTGQIWIVTSTGVVLGEPFLNIEDRMVELNDDYDERGLLGFAFHPDYATNGRFFVYYSAPPGPEAPQGYDHTSHLSEFRASAADPNKADPGSEQILLKVPQPQFNHNAGTLAFGPEDGYLYLSLGDGGGRDDEGFGPPRDTPVFGHVEDWYEDNAGGNGQDIEQNLLGSILRIDVDAGDPYAIPEDNPFVGGPGLDEQYAYGFRNPYRFSFDMGGDHALYVGDAGQNLWEEVSLVMKGGNYGWNVKEGTHCFDAEEPFEVPDDCPEVVGEGHPQEGDPLIDPVIEFPNAAGGSGVGLVVVGGYVYRGSQLPALQGRYLFGTWSRGEEEVETGGGGHGEIHFPGRIFVATPQPVDFPQPDLWGFEEVQISNDPDGEMEHFLLSFAQDREGEVYALTTDEAGPVGNTGKVYRLAAPMPAEEAFAAHLAGYNEALPNPLGPPEEVFPFTVETAASGSAIATLEAGMLRLVGSFHDLSADYVGSHIHEAPAGVNGSVVVPLSPTLDADQRGGTFDETIAPSPELVEALREGRLYVNIHTTAHPPGEIRGQLLASPNSAPRPVFGVHLAEGSFDFTNEGDPSNTAFLLEWDAVEDPDGDRVIYQVEAALDEAFMDRIAGVITVLNGEVVTALRATAGEVDAVLDSAGVMAGETATIYTRVNSSDGSLRHLGSPLTFNVTRGEVAAPAEDTMPPECELAKVDAGPPTTLRVRVRDGGSGLAAVRVMQSKNATVNVPAFTPGLQTVLFVTAEKMDESKRAMVVLEVEDVAGNVTTCDPVVTTVSAGVPESFELSQNYPNPFNPTTKITFQLPEASQVNLTVYDVVGREVTTLVRDQMEAGTYEVEWDGRDSAGRVLPSGLYLYRIEAGSFTESRTMTLLK